MIRANIESGGSSGILERAHETFAIDIFATSEFFQFSVSQSGQAPDHARHHADLLFKPAAVRTDKQMNPELEAFAER